MLTLCLLSHVSPIHEIIVEFKFKNGRFKLRQADLVNGWSTMGENTMPENSENKPEETSDKRMFKKGGAPGPGRGHKNPEAPIDCDLLDAIEKVVRSGMGKGELADRLKAAGLGLKIQGLKNRPDEEPILIPFVSKFMSLLCDLAVSRSQGSGAPISAIDVIDLMARACPGCSTIGAAKDESEIF